MLQINAGEPAKFKIKSIRKIEKAEAKLCLTSTPDDGSDKPPC